MLGLVSSWGQDRLHVTADYIQAYADPHACIGYAGVLAKQVELLHGFESFSTLLHIIGKCMCVPYGLVSAVLSRGACADGHTMTHLDSKDVVGVVRHYLLEMIRSRKLAVA